MKLKWGFIGGFRVVNHKWVKMGIKDMGFIIFDHISLKLKEKIFTFLKGLEELIWSNW